MQRKYLTSKWNKDDDQKSLFVCLGNICRSPSAEGFLAELERRSLSEKYLVDSAGTGGWHIGELLM